jgi:hypothetical protein
MLDDVFGSDAFESDPFDMESPIPIAGTGTGATTGYGGNGIGTVTAGAAAAVAPTVTTGAGGGGGKAKKTKKLWRPWSIDPPKKIKQLPKLPVEPQIVIYGSGGGVQAKQAGTGAGRLGVSGRGWAWQIRVRSESRGLVRIGGNGSGRQDAELRAAKRRMEEEWLLLRFLEAA